MELCCTLFNHNRSSLNNRNLNILLVSTSNTDEIAYPITTVTLPLPILSLQFAFLLGNSSHFLGRPLFGGWWLKVRLARGRRATSVVTF